MAVVVVVAEETMDDCDSGHSSPVEDPLGPHYEAYRVSIASLRSVLSMFYDEGTL